MTVLAVQADPAKLDDLCRQAGISQDYREAMETDHVSAGYGNDPSMHVYALHVDFANIQKRLEKEFTAAGIEFKWL